MPRRFICWSVLFCCSLVGMASPAAADDPKILADEVYGHKDGMALTFDVITPADANGAAVMHLQSGGWYSTWNEPANLIPASTPMLNEGITVFIVRHGSAPRFQVPDAVADVRRCVRFIRMNADDYGIDPERIGVLGGSAGGHLTLMLATTGDDGDPGNADPVLRASSRIACGVSLYPPTDLRGWTTDPPPAIAAVPGLEPPLDFDASLEESVSPILHVTEDDAPVIIIHGDLDELVPISHANNIMPVLEEAGVTSELLVIEGAAHGFDQQQNEELVLPAMMGWYKTHLGIEE
jgi:acetyl esterase/lipase